LGEIHVSVRDDVDRAPRKRQRREMGDQNAFRPMRSLTWRIACECDRTLAVMRRPEKSVLFETPSDVAEQRGRRGGAALKHPQPMIARETP